MNLAHLARKEVQTNEPGPGFWPIQGNARRWADRPLVGRTDEWLDRLMDGHTDGRSHGRMVGKAQYSASAPVKHVQVSRDSGIIGK